MKITFAGYNRGEVLADFPVLVRLSTSLNNFNYAHFASASGGDLRFTDAGGTRVIPHEIDEWNPNGESTVWVQVPRLTGTNDCIWAYWGNPAATTPLPATNVWVPQPWEGLPAYSLVWHLKESGFPYTDSVLQHPALTGGGAPSPVAGIVGTGESFNGSSTYLNAGYIDLGTAFTLSGWLNINPLSQQENTLFANKLGGWTDSGFSFFVNQWGTGDGTVVFDSVGSNNSEAKTATGAVSFGQWHLVTASVDCTANTVHLFVDGVNLATGPVGANIQTTNTVNVGAHLSPGCFIYGSLDEARIQTGTNSADWVWASYMTVAQNSALQSYSSVTSSVVVVPITLTNMSYHVSGQNLVLSGSGGVGAINASYQVWTSTNAALPMASWTPMSTNAFDTSGNFGVTIPIDSTKKQQFFRVVVPH
jgi:hypothetical protein